MENNTFNENKKHGLMLVKSSENTVRWNMMGYNWINGVSASFAWENVFEENQVYNNRLGMMFSDCEHITVSDNTVSYNLAGGLQILSSFSCDVQDNRVAYNGRWNNINQGVAVVS